MAIMAMTEEEFDVRLGKLELAVLSLTERVLSRKQFSMLKVDLGDEDLASQDPDQVQESDEEGQKDAEELKAKGKPFGGKLAPPFTKQEHAVRNQDQERDEASEGALSGDSSS